MERKGPWFWRFDKCIIQHCLEDKPQAGKSPLGNSAKFTRVHKPRLTVAVWFPEQDQRMYQRIWWEKQYCPGGKSEDPPYGPHDQFDFEKEDDRADRESKHNEFDDFDDLEFA